MQEGHTLHVEHPAVQKAVEIISKVVEDEEKFDKEVTGSLKKELQKAAEALVSESEKYMSKTKPHLKTISGLINNVSRSLSNKSNITLATLMKTSVRLDTAARLLEEYDGEEREALTNSMASLADSLEDELTVRKERIKNMGFDSEERLLRSEDKKLHESYMTCHEVIRKLREEAGLRKKKLAEAFAKTPEALEFSLRAFKKNANGTLSNSDLFSRSYADTLINRIMEVPGEPGSEEARLEVQKYLNAVADDKKLLPKKFIIDPVTGKKVALETIKRRTGSGKHGQIYTSGGTPYDRFLTKLVWNKSAMDQLFYKYAKSGIENSKGDFDNLYRGAIDEIRTKYSDVLGNIKNAEEREMAEQVAAYYLIKLRGRDGKKDYKHYGLGNKAFHNGVNAVINEFKKPIAYRVDYEKIKDDVFGTTWKNSHTGGTFYTSPESSFAGATQYFTQDGQEITAEEYSSGKYNSIIQDVYAPGQKRYSPTSTNILLEAIDSVENPTKRSIYYKDDTASDTEANKEERVSNLYQIVKTGLTSIVSRLGGIQQLLTTIAATELALSESIRTGFNPESQGGETPDGEIVGRGKSSAQSKQDAKDRKRQEQKSFIDLLIPALGKLLKKNPVWDAVKLLLFKLGATHPKTAAALLMGGAPLALGAARLGARALLGLPGWASGRSPLFRPRLAKVGTFGGPIANTKMWISDVNSNFFSNKGVYASLKNYHNTTIPRRLARIERLEKLRQTGTTFIANPDGTIRSTKLGKRGYNLLQSTKASLTPGGKLLGYTGAVWNGLAENAKFNWVKYSKQGRLGNLATLGKAAKGIPGLSAVVEILGDIPNIMTAARSGKKGALSKQLWSTGGAGLGAFAGAFLGPIGMLLGPLLGRGLGQGIGSRMEYLLRAIGDLGSAFSGLVQGIRDSWFGDALKLCGDAIVKLGELVGQGLMDTITILIKALGWLCDTIRWVVDEKYRNEKARGGDGKKQSQYIEDLDDPNSDAYKKIGESQEFYKKLESTLGIGSTHDIYGRNYGKIHSKFMKERTAALIKEGKDKEDAEAQATKEFKDAYNSAYAYIVNQSKKAAEGKLNNISTYGNAAGASVDGLTRYSRNASGEISENTKGNLVYMKDLKLAGIVPKGNSKPYIPVEHVGDIRYLDNTLNGMSLGEVKYSSNMGGAHNSGKNSHYNGKKVDVVTGKPLSVEQYTRLYNEGWFGSGTGAIGYEYYSGQKAVVTPAQYAQLMAEGKVVMAGNNHYDFGYLSAHGKSISASATGGVVTGGVVTGDSTETKVFQQTKDDVRSALLDFAKATNAKNKKDTIDRIVWDPTDVTGSLGCWGIVQLNNTGQMAY